MDKQNETVNIFLKSQSDKDRVLNGASSHSKYIILQNDTLQAENRAKTLEIIELQAKNDELESDNDRMSEGRRYTQGLLKNLVELEKMHCEIATTHVEITTKIVNRVDSYQNKALQHLKYLHCILLAVLGCVWETEVMDVSEFVLMTSLLSFCVAFSINMHKALVLPSFPVETERIDELNKKIKEIRDSQDFITDHIESL